MTTDLDGVEIDLKRAHVALDGTRWLWNFEHNDADEPLMLRIPVLDGPAVVLPLPVVYRDHGPLTPVPQPTTAAMYRQVLEAA
ncbi:MAG: phiSA1p31-related protein [Streptomyces sp.]|nr:phiSA1p31-related protein [Streptomyces sp.]